MALCLGNSDNRVCDAYRAVHEEIGVVITEFLLKFAITWLATLALFFAGGRLLVHFGIWPQEWGRTTARPARPTGQSRFANAVLAAMSRYKLSAMSVNDLNRAGDIAVAGIAFVTALVLVSGPVLAVSLGNAQWLALSVFAIISLRLA
jgi:hypothetical protein